MMDLLDFGVQVVAVSASGVLAPGPLFFTNILYGTKHGARSGLKIAYGHTVVELPLVILLAAGLFSTAVASQYASTIGLIGGVAIIGFAAVQIIGVARKKGGLVQGPATVGSKSPFVAGIALSALNPFFLVWWFTVGLKQITDSAAFGLAAGVAILWASYMDGLCVACGHCLPCFKGELGAQVKVLSSAVTCACRSAGVLWDNVRAPCRGVTGITPACL